MGGSGVGGAVILARVIGMQFDMVKDAAIQACPPSPPENSIYHQVPSELFPATVAVPFLGRAPTISYTVPGPERILAS
jgi:hypothetical protein